MFKFKRLEVSANIPLNSKEKIDEACRLLESFKPYRPVSIRIFNETCITVSARYSWFRALKLGNLIKDGRAFINGFNVILDD